MARFVTNDSVYEGRQLSEFNIHKIAAWIHASGWTAIDDVEQGKTTGVGFSDSYYSEGSVLHVGFGEWILMDVQNKVIVVKDEITMGEEFKNVSVHDGEAPEYSQEIQDRFGFHKATHEGPGAKAPKHAHLREIFQAFATELDNVLPDGRYKSLVMTELEMSSMWSHKSIANYKS